MHTCIRNYTKDKVNSSLTYIIVPKEYPKNWNDVTENLPYTSLRRVDNIEEIETIINERNKQYLQQAEGKLFTTEPLKIVLGEDRCTEDYNKILIGTFDDSNLHLTKLQQQYLKALKKHSGTLEYLLRNEITTSNIKKIFSKSKEKTSTSPSHRHLGHYKALVSDEREKNELYTKQTNQDLLTTIDNTLIIGNKTVFQLYSTKCMTQRNYRNSYCTQVEIHIN